MGILDQFIDTRAASERAGESLAVDISGASDAQVLHTLSGVFDADRERDRVDVLRDGDRLGTVQRESAAGIAGVGGSDGMQVPGTPRFPPSTWVCPVQDCGYTVITIALAGTTPTCGRHAGQRLVSRG